MAIIHSADSRRSSTPNGTMTTFASPTQGGSELSMWRVEAVPGSTGPHHAFDTELIWTIVDGSCTLEMDGEKHALATGDTAVLPGGVLRQFHADADTGFTAFVAAKAGARASGADGGESVLPAWIA